ncbi:MAG: hypothetical protein RLZZ450_4889 [Pseudomonadota bacterium]|jgi:hypothetical protein
MKEHEKQRTLQAWMMGLLGLCLAACSGGGDGSAAGSVTAQPRRVVNGDFGSEVQGRAEDYGDAGAKVLVVGRKGQAALSVEYVPQAGGGMLVVSKMDMRATAGLDAGVITETLQVAPEDVPAISLENSLEGAAVLRGLYSQAASDYYAAADTLGCTVPLIGKGGSCTQIGACCDQHDICLEKQNCSGLTLIFGGGTEACQKCNALLKTCLTTRAPGPSTCCGGNGKPNVCGNPSPILPPHPPLPFPNPTTSTGLDPSIGIPGSPVKRPVVSGDENMSTNPSDADSATTGGSQVDPDESASGDTGNGLEPGTEDEDPGLDGDPSGLGSDDGSDTSGADDGSESGGESGSDAEQSADQSTDDTGAVDDCGDNDC